MPLKIKSRSLSRRGDMSCPLPVESGSGILYRICGMVFSGSEDMSIGFMAENSIEEYRIPREIVLPYDETVMMRIPRSTQRTSGEFINQCILSYVHSIMPDSGSCLVLWGSKCNDGGTTEVIIADFDKNAMIVLHKGWNKMSLLQASGDKSFSAGLSASMCDCFKKSRSLLDPLLELSLRTNSSSKEKLKDFFCCTLSEWLWEGRPYEIWGMKEWKGLPSRKVKF